MCNFIQSIALCLGCRFMWSCTSSLLSEPWPSLPIKRYSQWAAAVAAVVSKQDGGEQNEKFTWRRPGSDITFTETTEARVGVAHGTLCFVLQVVLNSKPSGETISCFAPLRGRWIYTVEMRHKDKTQPCFSLTFQVIFSDPCFNSSSHLCLLDPLLPKIII